MPVAAPGRTVQAFHLMRAGRFAEAHACVRAAIAGGQRSVGAYALLATISLNLDRFEEAEEAVVAGLDLSPEGGDDYDGLAYVSMRLGDHARAHALYRRATEAAPSEPRFWYNLASSARTLGRLAEAEAACDRAIALDPAHHPSHLLRSELRPQSAEANHLEELRRALERPGVGDSGRMFLGYALAKELDDLGEYDEAFGWYARAAAARRRNLSYDVAVDVRKLGRIQEAFATLEPLAPAAPDRAGAPCIFILGLPRSGTTLLERILSGLPGAVSNGETDNLSRALLKAAPAGPADVFTRAAAADPGAVGAAYLRHARAGSGRAVIEKLPMNYLYLGAIRRSLPDAALMLMTRSPLDSCFAMFRTLFGEAYPFTYDFEDLARYYAAYARLIEHWKRLIGDGLHEVRYDALVERPTELGAEAARRCGLTWTDEAVDIRRNRSASQTASAAQVRRPIYTTSRDRSRHYRAHLGPLADALRRHGVADPEAP